MAASTTVLTVGHGHSEFDDYLAQLHSHGVQMIVDIRSIPLIRFAPWFNRANLQPALTSAGIGYEFLGDRLGGRPEGDEFYDADGHTLYDPLSAKDWFIKGIERVEALAAGATVALTCLEEEPERCHRHPLLGRILTGRGTDVLHVRRSGTIESQADVDRRMGVHQGSLLGVAWRSPLPMRGGHNKS
jgi:uncharacterized protein (DUF488 family)